MAHPIPVYNADGMQNIGGSLKEWVRITIKIGTHEEEIDFGVSDLGKTNVFLGYDWLKTHNPEIDWVNNKIHFTQCPPRCWPRSQVIDPDEEGEESIDEKEGQLLAIYIGEEEIASVSPTYRTLQVKLHQKR